MQPIQHTISRQGSNLFSASEVAETIGADLETINEWLEVGAIGRAVFGGGRFSKYELQRAALTLELVKLGLAPSRARDVIWEMEYDLQQIWGEAISKQYKAYANSYSKQAKEMVGLLVLENVNGRNRAHRTRQYNSARI